MQLVLLIVSGIQLHADFVGDLMPFVKHNEHVTVTFYEEKAVSVDLPPSVVLQIAETEPGFKGDSVNNVYKPAKLETGLEIKIPNHVNEGDLVKISTETGDFIERVKA